MMTGGTPMTQETPWNPHECFPCESRAEPLLGSPPSWPPGPFVQRALAWSPMAQMSTMGIPILSDQLNPFNLICFAKFGYFYQKSLAILPTLLIWYIFVENCYPFYLWWLPKFSLFTDCFYSLTPVIPVYPVQESSYSFYKFCLFGTFYQV